MCSLVLWKGSQTPHYTQTKPTLIHQHICTHTLSGAAHSKHTYGNLFHRNHHHSPQRHHSDVWTGCTGVWWRTSTCCACSWAEGSPAHRCHHNSLAPRHTRAAEAHSACRHTGSIWVGRCDCLCAQQSKVSTHNNDPMKCSYSPPPPQVWLPVCTTIKGFNIQ